MKISTKNATSIRRGIFMGRYHAFLTLMGEPRSYISYSKVEMKAYNKSFNKNLNVPFNTLRNILIRMNKKMGMKVSIPTFTEAMLRKELNRKLLKSQANAYKSRGRRTIGSSSYSQDPIYAPTYIPIYYDTSSSCDTSSSSSYNC